jgi:hypothetical protein
MGRYFLSHALPINGRERRELCQTRGGPNLWPSDGDAKRYDQEFTMGDDVAHSLPEVAGAFCAQALK